MPEADYKRFRCNHCAVEFESIKEKRYCTKKCNKAAIRKNKSSVSRAEYLTKVRESSASKFNCEHCGKEAHRKLSGTNKAKGIVNRFCSMACRSGAKVARIKKMVERRIETRACEVCGAAFETSRHRKVCSDECGGEKARRSVNAANRQKIGNKMACVCRQCGATFTPAYGDKRSVFCGDLCKRRYANKNAGNDHRHRARHYGVAYEPVNRIKVFDRDGWRCQICGKSTPRARMGSMTTNAPELDHRIPLSKGGGHLYSNVQCSCRACNGAKGNKTSAGQLPLLAA